MKKLLSICVFMLLTTLLTAQVSKTVNVTTAGTLTTLLTATEKTTVTNLTLTGNINSLDFYFMRDEMNMLENLDIKNTNIKEYGDSPENELTERCFYNNIILKSIVFPSSITSIRRQAFEGCTSLNCTLNFPETLQNISEQAFMDCSNLTGSLIIPNSVKTIGSNAFSNCTHLNGNIIIGNSVKEIAYSAFYNCSSLIGGLIIPKSVISIGQNAFQDCRNLSGNLIIGDSVRSIGEYAFANSGISGEITIPSLVQTIGKGAFSGLDLSGTLTIGNSVKTIGEYAFYSFNKISKVIIGDSVSNIGISAIYQQTQLNTLINEYSVSNKNQYFSSVDGVLFNKDKTVLIAYPPRKNGSYNIPNSVTKIDDWAFAGCHGFISSFTIPNSVSTIGNFAFWSCLIPGEINIPASVTKIGEIAFLGNDGLVNFVVANDNPNFMSSDGVLYNKNQTKLISYPVNKSGSYSIPNSVDSIATKAFAYSYNLTNLQFGNSVKSISTGAFLYCSNLQGNLYFPNSLVSIGDAAFQQCNKIAEIHLPNSLTTIGEGAFSLCSALTKFSIDKTTPIPIQPFTFGYVDKNQCVLEVPSGSKSLYQNASVWKDFFNIREMITTDINLNNSNKIQVYGYKDKIIIDGTILGEIISIFNLNGFEIQTVKSKGEKLNIAVDINGVYLVKTAEKTFKVIL